MNKKLTKLLSVFIIAGAIGTGSAFGLAGCGHKHSAASEWQRDETNHWHDCTANDGEKLDVGAHEYDNDSDASCNVCGYERQVTIAVTGVTLDQTAVTLKMGATVTATLVATVSPSNASNKQVSWSSSDETVATVANGVVTAVAAGNATITVTTADGSRTATCAVTVQAADVTPDPVTEYTVTFNMNGHGTAIAQATTVDGKITAPTAPTDDNFDFGGWYTDEACTTEYDFNTVLTADTTLYAKWTAKQTSNPDPVTEYTVTFNMNGHGTAIAQTTTVDGKITAPTAPTDNDYNFGGWYTDEACTTAFDFNTVLTVNTTLYAKWTAKQSTDPAPETYTVTWKNGETELEKDTNVAKDATPSYDGATPTKAATAQYTYTFNGWTDGTNTYGLTDELPAVTGDVTYTAVFAETVNKYTVTWKNGEETLATAQVEYGTVPTFTGAEPTKAATAQYTYTFAGWNEEVVAVTGEATYTAKFTETVNKYTVTWKNYDGTVLETDAEVPYGTVPTYDRENPTKVEDGKNFAFSGWDKEVVAVTGNVEYTAQFTELQSGQYSVTFNMNGHGGQLTDGVTTDGKITAPTAPTADGYTFGGWFETAACDGTAIDFATKEFTANATVYAKWTIIEYTVTFKNGEETVGDVQKYTIENKEITVPTVPAKTGYNGAWAAYDLDVLENKTVQAVYTAIVYTITYNLDGGTNAQDPATIYTIESEDITLAAPTKDGYRFDGWYNADNEKVETIAKGSTGDITLTAKWVEQVTLTVTDKNGTTVGSSAFDKGATVTKEELDELTTAPAGYAVWKVYTDFNAGTEYTAGEITADTTLVATFVLTEDSYIAALDATIALKNVTVTILGEKPTTGFAADGERTFFTFSDPEYRDYSAADGYVEYVQVNGEYYKRTVASTVEGYVSYDAYVSTVLDAMLGRFKSEYEKGTYDDKNDEYVKNIENVGEFKLTISDGKVTTMADSRFKVTITEGSDTITLPEAKEYTKFLELSTQPNNVISEDFSDYTDNQKLNAFEAYGNYGVSYKSANEDSYVEVVGGVATQVDSGDNNETSTVVGWGVPTECVYGDIQICFTYKFENGGNSWTPIRLIGKSASKTSYSEVFGFRTKSDSVQYRLDGGTETATGIANSVALDSNLHEVYIKYNTTSKKITITIDGEAYLTDLDTTISEIIGLEFVSSKNGAKLVHLDNIAVCANQITAGEYYETAIAALNAKYSAEYILADTVDGEGNPVKATHSINAERVTSIYDMYTNATDGVLLVYAPEGECADYRAQELIFRIDEMFVQLQEIDTDEAVLAAREVAKQAVQNYYNEIKSNYTERETELSSRLDIEFEVINNMTSVNDLERYTYGETRYILDEETGEEIEVTVTAEQVLAEIFEGVENDTTVWTGELNSAKAQAEIDLSAAGLDSIPNYTALMTKKDNGATTAESAAITAIEGIIAQANTDIAAVEVGADGAATVESIVAKAYSDIAAEIAKSSENIETVKTTAKATLATYAQDEINKNPTLIAAIETAVSNGNAAIDAIVVSGEVDFATASANVETALTNAMLAIDKLVAADTLAKTKASATAELNGLKNSTHNADCNTEIATLVDKCVADIGTAETVEQVDTLKQECVTAVEERIATLKTTQFTVTFANCDGVAEQQITYEGVATEPETNPTKADSLFRGWYADAECTTEFDFANVNIYDNTTVYAKWLAADVTITLKVNGEVYKTIKTFSGNEPDAPAIALPTEIYVSNKSFECWCKEGEDTEYSLPESFEKDATVTLNAKLVDKYATNADITESESWTSPAVTNTETGDKATGVIADKELFKLTTADASAIFVDTNCTINKKTFGGVTINKTQYNSAVRVTAAKNNGVSIPYTITAKENITIKAYVKLAGDNGSDSRSGNTSYSINGATPVTKTGIIDCVLEIKLKAGDTVDIYVENTSSSGGKFYLAKLEAQLSEDYTNMTVSYHKYNGTNTLGTTEDIAWSSLKKLKGTEETDSNANGAKFMGWATSESALVALTAEELAALEYKPGATINLYPVFKTANITVTYMIDYDGLGNGNGFVEYRKDGLIYAGGESSALATKPEDPALVDAKKTYRFVSTWYTDEACTDEFDFNTALSETITLYAKYEKIPYVKLTLMNGETELDEIYKAGINGENITAKIADPTPEEGYRFDGWYTQDGSTSGEWGDKVDFDKYTLNVTVDPETGLGALTLYAKFVNKSAKLNEEILFNKTDGSEVNANTDICGGELVSFTLVSNKKVVYKEDGTPATAQDDSSKTYGYGILPSGGAVYTITAKKAVTLKIYITVANSSFGTNNGDVELGGTVVDGLSFTSSNKEADNVAYLVTCTLDANAVVELTSSSGRIAIYAIYAEYTAG